jgi:putative membrane protein
MKPNDEANVDARDERARTDRLKAHAKLPLVLAGLLGLIMIATIWDPPAGRTSWLLEVGPAIPFLLTFAIVYRRFPMSHLAYVLAFLHVLILIYGGIHTYAETPLGNWAKETFELTRNPYDRVGHFALGFFPAPIIREVLLRRTPLVRGGWLTFLILSVVLAIGAFWELLEWWATLVVAPDVGVAFLGAQGDVWDAQWDMFLALVGAAVSLAILSGLHDRSMAVITEPRGAGARRS